MDLDVESAKMKEENENLVPISREKNPEEKNSLTEEETSRNWGRINSFDVWWLRKSTKAGSKMDSSIIGRMK